MKVFDIDNPVWSTFSKIFDLIVLNIIFLISCIPIITISTAVTALYYTTMRIVSGNVSYVTRDYWKSFKENFKQALVTGVIVFDVGVILAFMTYLSYLSDAYLGKVVFTVADVLFAGAVSYIFPSLAKFKMDTGKLFYNSFLMTFVHVPFTILNLGVLFITGLGVYLSILVRVLLIFCGFSAIALLQSLWFNYIFAKYMSKEDIEREGVYREEEKLAKKEKKAKDIN